MSSPPQSQPSPPKEPKSPTINSSSITTPQTTTTSTITTNKKPQSIPWTHQETVHLIESYQEKWYSLKRGQLKSTQWDEVAATVASRCGYHHVNLIPKSSIQCRHKMEKIRKRYREEKLHFSALRGSSWEYFSLMDAMERGLSRREAPLLPISAHPILAVPPPRKILNSNNVVNGIRDNNDGNYENDQEEEEDDEEEDDSGYRTRSRSINYILRKPSIVNRFSVANDWKKPSKVAQRFMESEPAMRDEEMMMMGSRKRGRVEMEMEAEGEEGKDSRSGFENVGGRASGLVVKELSALAEQMMIMESRKMEMVKEMERWRMEMENKQLEMILNSQRKVVEMIAESFGSSDVDD